MGRLLVRTMGRGDLREVGALLESHHMLDGKQLRRAFKMFAGSKSTIYLVAEKDLEIVGALLAQFNGFHVFLSNIAVAEHLRGQGVGRRMHQELERRAKKLGARGIITDSRMSAVGFYERQGYKIPGAVFLIRRFEEQGTGT